MITRLMPIAALAALGFAARATAIGDNLDSRVTAGDGWVAYRVPMVAGVNEPCCYSVRQGAETEKGCDLDSRGWSFVSDSDDPVAARDGRLVVYLKVGHGRVERVRAVGA
jgi:hypothetical protein